MKHIVKLLVLCLCPCISAQQFSDSFESGNLSKWLFKGQDFIVLNGQLKSGHTGAGTFDISAPFNSEASEIWSFYCSMEFNPSSQNYCEFYIAADSFPALAQNGYLVRMGNTADNLVFYKLTNGTLLPLINGPSGMLNKSSNAFNVRLKRNTKGDWGLSYKEQTADSFLLLGTCHDTTFSGGEYLGAKIVQTSSNAGKHFFDNVYTGKEITDRLAPQIKKVTVFFPDSIEVTFNEKIDEKRPGNFSINYFVPDSRNVVGIEKNTVGLRFPFVFGSGKKYTLKNDSTFDLAENFSLLQHFDFAGIKIDTAWEGDLFFNEVMPVPDPSQGSLPAGCEYVELCNRSDKYLILANLKLSDAVTRVQLPDSVIPPHTCFSISKNTFSALAVYGKWVGLSSFPVLNNDEDKLKVFSANTGKTIAALHYKTHWHSNAVKALGGWSLERIDTAYYCLDEQNWTSNKTIGGTPGMFNSVLGDKVIFLVPEIIKAEALTPDRIVVWCNVATDSVSASQTLNCHFKNYPAGYKFRVTDFAENKQSFTLLFDTAWLKVNQVEEITLSGLKTCFGESFKAVTLRLGLYDTSIVKDELIINELLFDPKDHNDDYVELYNRGSRILNLQNLLLSSRDATGNPGKIYEISKTPRVLLPGEYLLLTTSIKNICNQYISREEKAMLELTAMPSMPNDNGNIELINRKGESVDFVEYNGAMHHPAVKITEGVALERISMRAPSNLAANWSSATQASGYGTPGIKNSVFQDGDTNVRKNFSFKLPYCSPNGDGYEDNMILNYQLPLPGFLATVSIFDSEGNYLYTPLNNVLLNRKGEWIIDLMNNTRLIKPGNYPVLIECWNKNGQRIHQKLIFSVLL